METKLTDKQINFLKQANESKLSAFYGTKTFNTLEALKMHGFLASRKVNSQSYEFTITDKGLAAIR